MRRRKEGGRTGQSGRRIESVECPKCGCPNKPGASCCMFCEMELEYKNAGFSYAVLYYGNYLKSRLGGARLRFPVKPGLVGRVIFTALLACILGVIGAGLVIRGIEGGGFFNWAVGGLCLAYAASLMVDAYGVIRKR